MVFSHFRMVEFFEKQQRVSIQFMQALVLLDNLWQLCYNETEKIPFKEHFDEFYLYSD